MNNVLVNLDGRQINVVIESGGLGAAASVDLALIAADVAAAQAAADAAAASAIEAATAAEGVPAQLEGKADIDGSNITDPDAFRTAIDAVGSTELAASTGSALVGSILTGTGAVARTQADRALDYVSVMDFIPVAEHAAIRARTSTTNVTAYFNAAMLAHKAVFVPAGTYVTGNIQAQQNEQTLFGVGPASRINFLAGAANFHFSSNGFTTTLHHLDFFGGNDGGKGGVASPASDRAGVKLDYDIACAIHDVTIHGYDSDGIGPENAASSVAGVFYAANVNIYSCWQGVSATFSEYTTWSRISITSCRRGFYLASGNVTLADSLIEYNYDNLYIEGSGDANNGHGGVINCRMNHATFRAVYCNAITNGHNFIGNDIFYGQIILADSTVSFIGNTISVSAIGISGTAPNLFIANKTITVPGDGLNNSVTDSGGRAQFILNREASTGYPIWNTGSDVFGKASYVGGDVKALMIGENGALTSEGFEVSTNGAAGNMKIWKIAASARASVATMIFNRLTGRISQQVCEFASAVDDAAAATAGVPVGGLYQNAGAVRQRLV